MQVLGYTLLAAGAYGSYKAEQGQTDAQVKSYEFNADVNERDKVVEQNREQFREIQMTDEFLRARGQAVAAYASSGVGMSGSVWDVLDDQATQYAMGMQSQRYESQVALNNLTDQAGLNRAMAVSTKKIGSMVATTKFLTNMGSMAISASSMFTGGGGAPNMTTAQNNFSGPNGASLARGDAQFAQMFKSAGLQPINTGRRY